MWLASCGLLSIMEIQQWEDEEALEVAGHDDVGLEAIAPSKEEG